MLAITGVSAAMILKQWKADYLPVLRLALSLLFAVAAITAATPAIAFLRELTEESSASEYAGVLLRALGIAVLTQSCSDICKECGESGIAGGVELIGKVEILLLSLPLIREILSAARELFSF